MIKNEHLKHAVDAIAGRDPEAGYALGEMLAAGRIRAGPEAGDPSIGPRFFIDGRTVAVPRFIFFKDGAAALEQHLVHAHARMAMQDAVAQRPGRTDFHRAAIFIRTEALRRTVAYEIAAARGEGNLAAAATADLVRLTDQPLPGPLPPEQGPAAPAVRYVGRLDDDRPALFIPFPLCLEALVQVVERNLEFFNLRFVLRCHLRGELPRLFALLVQGRIAGLAFVDLRRAPFYQALEIQYIATRTVEAAADDYPPPPRGVGTCLVGGLWMLCREHRSRVNEMVLDSELGASGFYRRIGFRPRRIQQFVLRQPEGPLLATIATMADHCRHLHPRVETELARRIRQAHRRLRRSKDETLRQSAVQFLRACLLARRQPALARTAAAGLMAAEARIPEARVLLTEATRHGRLRIREAADRPPLLVVCDRRYADHLSDICHMESPRRMEAAERVLAHPDLVGRWQSVAPRPATAEELAWIHTAAHIRRIARTAGQPLSTLDLDTQTTGASFATACLAVGGVFELVEAVWRGRAPVGFAFVRPPGHHAEPDRAMGFCLFNNVALAAAYLQRLYGVARIMIVDIDAHHGNGTQQAFYDSDRVLFVSLHEFPAYPGTGRLAETGTGSGRGHTVNVPLPKGANDNAVTRVLHWIVRPLARAYRPEILLVSCGFDLYRRDRLSHMAATAEGYARFGRLLTETAAEVCAGRIVFVLEGGYHVESIETCGRHLLRALCGLGPAAGPGAGSPCAAVRKAIAVHQAWWPTLTGA